MANKKIKALSLNGGGIRVMIMIETLIYLEKITGKPCYEYFDYFAGTSGGSILISLILKKYTAQQIKDILLKEHKDIFKKRWFLSGLVLSKYDNKKLISLLTKYLGEIKMNELNKKVIIPTVNADTDMVELWKTGKDRKLVDGVIASSSAPVYFPKYKTGNFWYEDGGTAYNNPSELLYNQLEKDHPYEKVYLININSGAIIEPTTKFERVAGVVKNLPSVISTLFLQQDHRTHQTLAWKLDGEFEDIIIKKNNIIYCRIPSTIFMSSGKMDDNSKNNMERMEMDGQITVDRYRQYLHDFVNLSK